MESSPKLSTHVVVSRAITFDSCSDLSSATHDKCANNVSTMLVELQWLSGCRSLSGKKTRTWMVTQQTRISLEACIVLRVHLTAMLTSLVLCNPTSYTCGNTWMHTIFWQHLSPRIEERGFRPSFDLTKQHLLTSDDTSTLGEAFSWQCFILAAHLTKSFPLLYTEVMQPCQVPGSLPMQLSSQWLCLTELHSSEFPTW